MRASLLYRIAAVLLLLFAASHTLGFTQSDPSWGVQAMLAAMKSIRFDTMGARRTYWDFFVAAGYSTGVLYGFAAALAWQLAGLPAEMLQRLRGVAWAFALAFAFITFVSARHLFVIPIAFSAMITVCLAAAAWRSGAGSADRA